MGIIGKQKYAQEKVDMLYNYLNTYHEKGMSIDYEILVDGFKAVRRTNDPNMFYMFESFINAESRALEILFYTGSSNNNDKHIYTFNEESKEQGLSGIEIDNKIQEGVERERRNWEFDSLKKENKELRETILELEEEIDQLEEEKVAMTQGQSPLKGILGELGSSFVESMIRRNPRIIAKLPGGETLAGLIEADNNEQQAQPVGEDAEISFTAKRQDAPTSEKNAEPQLTEEEQQAITFVNQLKDAFNKEEFEQLMEIIQHMAADKESIKEVSEYLKHQQNA